MEKRRLRFQLQGGRILFPFSSARVQRVVSITIMRIRVTKALEQVPFDFFLFYKTMDKIIHQLYEWEMLSGSSVTSAKKKLVGDGDSLEMMMFVKSGLTDENMKLIKTRIRWLYPRAKICDS